MDKKLTISVAAYNIEQYIDKLMKSIIETGMIDDIEVLIVNDGSKDNTAKKAFDYQQQYPESVRLIDKTNGGHGSTINRGIIEAKGKYFRALDGDDWIHPEHLANLVSKMAEIDVDVILSDYYKCFADGREEVVQISDKLDNENQYSFDYVADRLHEMPYHSVIYRTNILKDNGIHLDERCYYVDTEFMLFPLPFVKTVYYSKNPIYCYRLGINGQSVSASSRQKNINDSKRVSDSIFHCFDLYRDTLSEVKKRYMISKLSYHCRWHEKSLLLFPASSEKKRELVSYENSIKSDHPEVYSYLMRTYVVFFLLRVSRYSLYRLFSRIFIKLEEFRSQKAR